MKNHNENDRIHEFESSDSSWQAQDLTAYVLGELGPEAARRMESAANENQQLEAELAEIRATVEALTSAFRSEKELSVAPSDMDAFFAVEQKPGGVTEIILNREHPAHEQLLTALDESTGDSTERELVERICNASETIKMLFAAWARQEIEDVPNREKLRRMRQDWGRMARDFLLDGD